MAAAVDPLGVVTVTNRTRRVLGAVTWTKVDGANGPLLAGSAWTVVGPGADGPSRVVTDCVAAGCEGPDRDPIAGRFRLEGLLWGSYTVTESTVPEGYTGVSEFTFTVGQDGTVSITTAGNPAAQVIGNIQTADFVNPAGLQAIGNNLFLETASSGAPQVGTPGLTGLGTVLQNTLENSNVSVVEELVNMITTQRAYEMNSKVISTADQMLSFVTQNL